MTQLGQKIRIPTYQTVNPLTGETLRISKELEFIFSIQYPEQSIKTVQNFIQQGKITEGTELYVDVEIPLEDWEMVPEPGIPFKVVYAKIPGKKPTTSSIMDDRCEPFIYLAFDMLGLTRIENMLLFDNFAESNQASITVGSEQEKKNYNAAICLFGRASLEKSILQLILASNNKEPFIKQLSGRDYIFPYKSNINRIAIVTSVQKRVVRPPTQQIISPIMVEPQQHSIENIPYPSNIQSLAQESSIRRQSQATISTMPAPEISELQIQNITVESQPPPAQFNPLIASREDIITYFKQIPSGELEYLRKALKQETKKRKREDLLIDKTATELQSDAGRALLKTLHETRPDLSVEQIEIEASNLILGQIYEAAQKLGSPSSERVAKRKKQTKKLQQTIEKQNEQISQEQLNHNLTVEGTRTPSPQLQQILSRSPVLKITHEIVDIEDPEIGEIDIEAVDETTQISVDPNTREVQLEPRDQVEQIVQQYEEPGELLLHSLSTQPPAAIAKKTTLLTPTDITAATQRAAQLKQLMARAQMLRKK